MKKTYKIEVDCANCANLMEEAANKVEDLAWKVSDTITDKMDLDMQQTGVAPRLWDNPVIFICDFPFFELHRRLFSCPHFRRAGYGNRPVQRE